MGYRVTREAMRVVQRNERGVVIYRKRYKRGQRVDVARLPEGRLEALVASGALVNEAHDDDDAGEYEDGRGPVGSSGLTGAATDGSYDHADDTDLNSPPVDEDADADEDDPDVDPAAAGPVEDPEDPPTVDQYTEMDYDTLKAEADKRGVSKAGGAEGIRTRLREADAASA